MNKKRKSPKIKKRKRGLLNASYDECYEYFHVGGKLCEYIIHFHKQKSLTSWIVIPSLGEDKNEISRILEEIDKFRNSLYE